MATKFPKKKSSGRLSTGGKAPRKKSSGARTKQTAR
jgi:hypothetical protein